MLKDEITLIKDACLQDNSVYIDFAKDFSKNSALSYKLFYEDVAEDIETFIIDTTAAKNNIKVNIDDSNHIHSLNRAIILTKLLYSISMSGIKNDEKDRIENDLWKELFFIFWRLENFYKMSGKTLKHYLNNFIPGETLANCVSWYYSIYCANKSEDIIKNFKFKEFILEV